MDEGARQRKSQRVSIFVDRSKREGGDDYEQRSAKPQDSVTPTKKRRSSSRTSIVKASKGFSKPVKKRKRTSIEFIREDSVPLESRIKEPSWLSKTLKFLTKGLIDPGSATAEESYIYQLRSFWLYVLHAILVFWVVYGTFDLEYNYHSIIVSDMISKSYFESSFVSKIIQFNDIRAPQQIWDFVRGVILKIIYPIETYNNTQSIFQSNIMIGVARIFQVRVKNNSCTSAPFFRDLYKACHGYIDDEDAVDTEPFGPNSSSSWRYTVNLDNIISRGRFNDFTGNGYVIDFDKDYNSTLKKLDEFENDRWIRLGTRAVFLDFALYCPNTHSFLVAKITMEILPWGAVLPSLHMYSIKLVTSFNGPQDFLILGLNIILLGYTIGLNYAVWLRLKRNGLPTLFTFKNLIDLAIISSTYATFGIHVALAYYTKERFEAMAAAFMSKRNKHPTFGNIIFTFDTYFTSAAILLLCIVLKFIRYGLYFNETAKLLVCAIKKVKGELFWFSLMNICVLFGWGIILCTIYGPLYPQAMSPFSCLGSLIFSHARGFIVDTYDETRTLPFPSSIVISFVMPFAILYINCISQQTYLALMVHGWKLAVRDCAKEAGRIKVNEITLSRIVEILEKLKMFTWANKLQERHIIHMNEDDYYPFTAILRRYGWSRLKIRLLLRKYGIRKGDDLTIDELFEVYQDFWTRNTLFLEVGGHEELKHDLEYAQRLMIYCESTIADLKFSIERLADQFLSEKVKKKPSLQSEDNVSTTRRSLIGRLWK